MTWQDITFSVGAIVFTIVLIPTLLNKNSQMPRSSTILTATVLTVYSFTFYSLELDFSAISTMSTAAIWWLLAVFRPIRRETK